MVQSVERAFRILEILYEQADSSDGIGVLALSRQLDLKLPTVHNLLKTLVKLGYAEQNAEGKYRPGPKSDCFRTQSDSTLLNIARPHIASMVRDINETAVLIVYHDGIRYTLLQEECKQQLRVSADTAPNNNLCGTATGMAILSEFPRTHLEDYLQKTSKLKAHFAGIEQLEQALSDIRHDGYIVMPKEEYCVFGVPLAVHEVGLFASLGVFVPSVRFNQAVKGIIVTRMKNAARAIKMSLKNII
jgi:IclR family acetate operon transcriptional repressor